MIRTPFWLLTSVFLNVCQANDDELDTMKMVSENTPLVGQHRAQKSGVDNAYVPNKQIFALPSTDYQSKNVCHSDALNADITDVKIDFDYELSGILYSTGGYYTALLKSISGHSLMVKTGQRVGNTQIVEITENSLRFHRRQLNSLGCWEEHDFERSIKQSD
ncbi:hypothetical protein [Vibrio caribbeanicus]|uniref:hypothetical protein n=1 Tax=Vibrio caribbeanicus TaxID=701175 RepID=UPI0022837A42|nr:hypothetical protein [Vibrio caribbeanicus]MCY9845826.1 hypothetical protein [Vibrio caribbeanicus]